MALYGFESRRGRETERQLVRLKLTPSPLFLIVYSKFDVVSRAILRAIPVFSNLSIWISEIKRAQSQERGFMEEQAEQFFRRLWRVKCNSLSAIVTIMQ